MQTFLGVLWETSGQRLNKTGSWDTKGRRRMASSMARQEEERLNAGAEEVDWERESVVSGVVEDIEGDEEGEGEGRVERQVRRKKIIEMERRKRMEEEVMVRERDREEEEENDRRKEDQRRMRMKERSFEDKVYEIEHNMKEIIGAVSREEGKSKIQFGREQQQIVKNAVFAAQECLISILVEQMGVERKNRKLEEERERMVREQEETYDRWERREGKLMNEIKELKEKLKEREEDRDRITRRGTGKSYHTPAPP